MPQICISEMKAKEREKIQWKYPIAQQISTPRQACWARARARLLTANRKQNAKVNKTKENSAERPPRRRRKMHKNTVTQRQKGSWNGFKWQPKRKTREKKTKKNRRRNASNKNGILCFTCGATFLCYTSCWERGKNRKRKEKHRKQEKIAENKCIEIILLLLREHIVCRCLKTSLQMMLMLMLLPQLLQNTNKIELNIISLVEHASFRIRFALFFILFGFLFYLFEATKHFTWKNKKKFAIYSHSFFFR